MARKKTKAKPTPKKAAPPAVQAKPRRTSKPIPPGGSPINGVVPPVEHRFPPGVSGNPEGRPKAGATIKEWLNVLQNYTEAQLRSVLDDPNAPAFKKVAARSWLHAMSEEMNAGGMPVAGADMERILDYTDGRPTQHTDVTSNGETVKQFVNVNVDAV